MRPRVRSLDLTEATWRGRAVRYVLIYLALALALVGARYFTQDIRPALRAVQEREATLLTQRNDLAVQVQTLENPQRIRDWAFANGMVRFAEAPKESQAILPLPPPGRKDAAATPKPAAPDSAPPAHTSSPVQPPRPPAQPDNTVEVRTQWR
ncbi:hypothetical protein HLB42_12230 [Deinococcus sp. D7000]|nr:hypothetical protein HLB42_12230 [Deinococcus sp. D7000]